jgi:hypothetical protein
LPLTRSFLASSQPQQLPPPLPSARAICTGGQGTEP